MIQWSYLSCSLAHAYIITYRCHKKERIFPVRTDHSVSLTFIKERKEKGYENGNENEKKNKKENKTEENAFARHMNDLFSLRW